MYFRAYQKWLHVLLCEDDRGSNGGRGRPVRRAFYGDCILLESTGFFDRDQREVFEGDIVKVRAADGRAFTDVVGEVPDSFGAAPRHPLEDVLRRHGADPTGRLEVEVLGNEYEHPGLVPMEVR